MGVLAVFDREGRWSDTHVCDPLITRHLALAGVTWGPRSCEALPQACDVPVRLYYLTVVGGHLGVLCEPGEWVSAVPGAHEGPALIDASSAPAGLPGLEEFIATMLELTGHAQDEA